MSAEVRELDDRFTALHADYVSAMRKVQERISAVPGNDCLLGVQLDLLTSFSDLLTNVRPLMRELHAESGDTPELRAQVATQLDALSDAQSAEATTLTQCESA